MLNYQRVKTVSLARLCAGAPSPTPSSPALRRGIAARAGGLAHWAGYSLPMIGF